MRPVGKQSPILGVVELINKHSVNHRFARQDLQMLTTLLGPIAVSLHNALLFKETEKLVVTDDLTKLYNNRFVNQFLEEMIEKHRAKRKKFAILFLDLDGFKSVNDCYGHMVGGRTLVEVGNVIFHTVRKDDLVARYGGDEFIVMMPNAGIVEAVEMAETNSQGGAVSRFYKGYAAGDPVVREPRSFRLSGSWQFGGRADTES